MFTTGVSFFSPASSAVSNMAVMPFTYDETDRLGQLTFSRQGLGPHQTPMGFEGDGYQARYKATVIPSWMSLASSAFGMQMSYLGYSQYLADANTYGGPIVKETFTTFFHAGADTTGAAFKCVFGLAADNGNSLRTCVVAKVGTSVFTFNRPNWKFQWLTPQYTESSKTWIPNALVFKDASKLWCAAHLQDTLSRVWEINPDTGVLTRSFNYPLPYTHVANFAIRGNGDVWFTDSPTSKMGIVDMEASFSSGTAVIPTLMDTTSFNKIGAIDFVTIGGTEYFVAAEYATSGTPYLYVFLASKVGAVTLTAADRVKRWPIGLQVQGLVMKGSTVYLSFSASGGLVRSYDLATMIASLADGATPTVLRQEDAATSYPEDMCVHPVTGDFWMPIEGNATVNSDRAHLSFWSSPLTGVSQESYYTVNYDGVGTVTLLHNGRDYYTFAVTPTTAVACVSIGGPPQATAGPVNGYMFGFARNLAYSDTPISAAAAANIASGSYEPRTLTAISIPLTNPGAESGITSWTVESGTLSQIANTGSTANLIARSGTNAFGGVNAAGYVARQRVGLTGLGLTTAQLDSGGYWLKSRWWQASLNISTPRDAGGNGLRLLDATPTQISETYSPQYTAPSSNGTSHFPWSPRSLPVPITTNSRNVDVLMKGTRTGSSGSTQAFVDDNELWIYGP